MRVKLQLVMCSDEGQEETVTDVITLNKNSQRIEHLGLTLAESTHLLSTLQRHLLQQQVDTFLDTCSTCPDCGTPLQLKARASRSFRTLFGTVMKLTVFGQYGKGLGQCEAVLGEAVRDKIERLKWSLWHGQVDKALGKIDDLESAIEPFSETYARFSPLVKALSELRTYIVNNRHLIPNYGERYRHGEAIATGFVESTVNEVVSKRFCKKQQMQWSKEGAHLLLQTRVRTLNGELGTIFKRWYPDMDLEVEAISVAA